MKVYTVLIESAHGGRWLSSDAEVYSSAAKALKRAEQYMQNCKGFNRRDEPYWMENHPNTWLAWFDFEFTDESSNHFQTGFRRIRVQKSELL